MKSTAADVVAYIEEQPNEWQPVLKKLRAACRRGLPGYRERMAYGMPSYERNGAIEVSFAKQARHLAVYVLKQPVLDAHRPELTGLSLGKGCIRYSRPDQIDWNVISSLLEDTYASPARIC
jgi:uncharacterized protein YdhG (YjbR/CyaY superfamily)